MAKIEKTFNGKRFTYLCNGEVYKNSTRDYKYACVATTRKAKGALIEGKNEENVIPDAFTRHGHWNMYVKEHPNDLFFAL